MLSSSGTITTYPWRKSIDVLEDGGTAPRTYALFPEDRCEGLLADESIVRPSSCRYSCNGAAVRVLAGADFVATLGPGCLLDVFWAERLPPSRNGTRWDLVLFVLGAY